ncbi:MAG: rhodanese-like domain-containing protein [Halioglobus sp.]
MDRSSIKQSLVLVLAMLVSQGVLAAPDFWIDVRSQQEYDQSHVSGAIRISHEEIKAQIEEVTQDKDSEIYLYCGSGYRSGIAMSYLQSMGYTRVKNVGGLSDALELEASSKP